MRFLALDLATSTGWATNYPAVESGTQVFDVKRGESPGMRYLRFRAWLESMISTCQPEVLVYEQTHQRGGAATEIAAGLATRVQEMAAQHGLQHVALHSSTLKKHATGSGRAGKPEMMAAASTFYPGQVIRTDDQGDALCLLHWAIEEYDMPPDVTPRFVLATPENSTLLASGPVIKQEDGSLRAEVEFEVGA